MADIFDELNEDLRAERARGLARRYGAMGAGVLVVVLIGVGGWQGWKWQQSRQAEAASGPYLAATGVLTPGAQRGQPTDPDAFAKIAATAPTGYRTLAELQEAALRWSAGDTAKALALWDKVGTDGDSPMLRDLGNLLWAQHSIDAGDPSAIAARTSKLQAQANPWRPLAQEVDAMVAIRQDDKDKATRLLRTLVADPAAADGLRRRASELLVVLGAPPEARG
ncbi:tetratricopeptide repeat protein [Acidisphaera sp. L21]|uniref:tetratricopeptide repeat protein n=1 Tax=Acidisphaera sp. L21 TaxID=1641851 RepID=UPI0020B14253|nr:tetratricopeptide repeat protein [Acidisphaera sp. L21]